jgi:uracil-DNA glycosylase
MYNQINSDIILKNIQKKWLDIIYTGKCKIIIDTFIHDLNTNDPDNLDINVNNLHHINNMFDWCRRTDLDNIKVVIIEQDSSDDNDIHRLLFSDIKSKKSPSIKNIYKCLKKSYNKHPNNIDLTHLGNQGVLILNSSLIKHKKKYQLNVDYWHDYIEEIISRICLYYNNICEQIIFLLWGSDTYKFKDCIDCDFNNTLLWCHPNPLYQPSERKKKFINCDHFINVNKLLQLDYKTQIDWMNYNSKEEIGNIIIKDADDIKYTWAPPDRCHYIFTDGSCNPNNKSPKSIGGYSAIFASGLFNGRKIYGNLDVSKYNASNIRAEGFAIIRSMEMVLGKIKTKTKNNEHCHNNTDDNIDDWDVCNIITDCKFWIDMIYKYMPKWTNNKFTQQSNPDLTKRIWVLWREMNTLDNKEINILHIKSHNKSGWRDKPKDSYEKWCYNFNEQADFLCKKARLDLKQTQEIIVDN